MAETTDPPMQAPKKKKKTLAFLRNTPKPAPAHTEELDESNKGQEDEDDDGLDMFRRSKDFFPTIIKKQESEAREATPEPHVESKKHAPEDSDEDPVPSSSRSSKRRRTSSPEPHPWRVESFDELYGPATPPRRSSKSPTPASRRSNRQQSTPASIKRKAHADSPIISGEGKGEDTIDLIQSDLLPTPPSRSNSHQLSTEVIPLVSDDEDEPATGTWRNHPSSPAKSKSETRSAEKDPAAINAIVVDDSDDNLSATASEPKDDEFAHFVAAARRKQEAAKAAAAALASPGDSVGNEKDSLEASAAGAHAKNNAPYEVVRIFVHSRIAAYAEYDPQGFGCQRKINQSVGPVRDAFSQWLRRKGVPVKDEMDRAIFLTWKGRKIYNSVSGLSLGWQPQRTNKPHEREPGFIRDGVLLEAWTEEDFERYTADLERQRLINRGELVDDGPGVEVADDTEEQAEPEVAKVKVILKEKNTEPVRMTTFLDTQVRVLIGAYRRQKKVAEDREIRLNYDGDWLNPEMTVAQAYIDDMCTVEVYIK